ncbi:hypothetical protein AB0M02_38785 [Actinoplanes sp. NPDC051861]|uniref:hypothetical protein n=1 Tax=Actinoplanes sp. NPDC051861 TaxID=3155170 RepID=UPI00343E596C
MLQESVTAPPVTDADLDRVARARFAAWLLGARGVYQRLLRQTVESEFARARTAFRGTEGDAVAEGAARNAVIGINSYQVWRLVLTDQENVDNVLARAVLSIATGCLLGAAHFVWQDPSWTRLVPAAVFAGIAVVTAAFVFGLAIAASESRVPGSKRMRNALGAIFFGAAGILLAYLYQEDSFWSDAVFTGAASATGCLFLLAVGAQIARVTVGMMYRYTWSRFPAEEIVQSLAMTLTDLDQATASFRDPEDFPSAVYHQINAGLSLNHVADCMERYLPRAMGLAEKPALSAVVLPGLTGAANHTRALAQRCLLPGPGTHDALRDDVSELLVHAARGHWGAWESRTVPEPAHTPRRRTRLPGATMLRLAPVLLVFAGLILLYRNYPRSSLLEPEIVGPIAAAAFVYLTSMLATGVSPRHSEVSPPDSTSQGRQRGH